MTVLTERSRAPRRWAVLAVLPLLTAGGRPRRVEQIAMPLVNVRAFAKLYGYVRFFHPSDEASSIDWDRFAILGVDRVTDASSVDVLQERLEEPNSQRSRPYCSSRSPPLRHEYAEWLVAATSIYGRRDHWNGPSGWRLSALSRRHVPVDVRLHSSPTPAAHSFSPTDALGIGTRCFRARGSIGWAVLCNGATPRGCESDSLDSRPSP